MTSRQAYILEMFEMPIWDKAVFLFRGIRNKEEEADRVVNAVLADVARDCPAKDDAIIALMVRLTTERALARLAAI
jgi:hypothetical protein